MEEVSQEKERVVALMRSRRAFHAYDAAWKKV